MLIERDERREELDEVRSALRRVGDTTNSTVIVAATGDVVLGYVEATGGGYRRNRFTAYVVIGVLAAASGHGIGSQLLAELERWAVNAGVHRLELTVMAHNHRAIRLYERAGFLVEGCRCECLSVDGELVDELYMAKLLPAAVTPL